MTTDKKLWRIDNEKNAGVSPEIKSELAIKFIIFCFVVNKILNLEKKNNSLLLNRANLNRAGYKLKNKFTKLIFNFQLFWKTPKWMFYLSVDWFGNDN